MALPLHLIIPVGIIRHETASNVDSLLASLNPQRRTNEILKFALVYMLVIFMLGIFYRV